MKKINREISAIYKYLIPLIFEGLISSLKIWEVVFCVSLIANLVAIWITYSKGEKIRITEFFPPNIIWGLLITLGVLFVYKSASSVALKLNKLQSLADKYTTNDIEFEIIHFPSDYIVAYGIRIRNLKPFILENFLVTIIKFEVGKRDYTPHHLFPTPLPWLEDRSFIWAPYRILSGEEKTVALFGLNDYKDKISLFFPGPDGQPSEIKSMGEVESNEGVLFADFELAFTVEGHEIKKQFRIRAFIDNNDSLVELTKDLPA